MSRDLARDADAASAISLFASTDASIARAVPIIAATWRSSSAEVGSSGYASSIAEKNRVTASCGLASFSAERCRRRCSKSASLVSEDRLIMRVTDEHAQRVTA
jgi:hypothetical protein